MPLIESLIQEGWLKTPQIISAFRKIQRIDFLPDYLKELAELNEALPIGGDQTISQPLVVAFMMELLQPETGDKILDVGSGSGWTSALLAHIVSGGELNEKLKMKNEKLKGKVIAIEIVPELLEFGKQNVSRYNFIEKGIVEFICADGSKGYPQYASRPELVEGFDKILASATAQFIPQSWKEQLKIGGRIVAPIGASIWAVKKVSEKRFEENEYPGFVFVPLITT
jgi:protein-L-isoaspartate(D-aspartate) O-methyltransferase